MTVKQYIRRYRSIILAVCCIYVPIVLLYKFYDTILSKRHVQCQTDVKFKKKLLDTLKKTSSILNNQNIEYFLCYNSLWSFLRFEGLAPWDTKVTICALNSDLQTLDELYLRRLFSNQQLKLDYKAYDGFYTVSKDSSNPLLELYVFDVTMSNKEYKRVGIRRRVFPEGSDILHQFPSSLVTLPLPTVNFGNLKVTVPREGIELQKYLYRDSWWIVKKPKGC